MRAVKVMALLTLGACASSGSNPASTASSTRTQTVIGGGSLRTTTDQSEYVSTIESSVEPVWKSLPMIYDSLGIPLTVMDFKAHLIGNQGLKIRQTLGKVPLSKYIDCGTAQLISSADTYDVFLTVVSHVRPNEPVGSDIVTTVTAAAKPLNVSQEYFQCSTKGELERKIADMVKAAVRR